MYKESLKVFLIGLAVSVVSWWSIISLVGTPEFTPIYGFVIISAFLGLTSMIYGLTNSGYPTDEELKAEKEKMLGAL